MKKLVSALATGVLIVGSLALAAPANAVPVGRPAAQLSAISIPSAQGSVSVATAKSKAPRIIDGKKKTTKTKAPNRSVQTVKLPSLQHSTAKNRKNFSKYANDLVDSERKGFNASRKGACLSRETAVFKMTPGPSSIHKGRYASVTMRSVHYLCGTTSHSNVRSFTMDLKTGKKVGISKFVDQDDFTTKVAVASNFAAAKDGCGAGLYPFARKNKEGYIPRPAAWDVSSQGIRFHYGKHSIGPGACGNPSVLLPWREVATATSMKGKVHNRTYVRGIKYDKGSKMYSGDVIVTSVQGRKVTVFSSVLNGDGACLHGVRSGTKAFLGSAWGGNGKVTAKLQGTSANPKFDTADIGKGWREANASDLKALKYTAGATLTARKVCGA